MGMPPGPLMHFRMLSLMLQKIRVQPHCSGFPVYLTLRDPLRALLNWPKLQLLPLPCRAIQWPPLYTKLPSPPGCVVAYAPFHSPFFVKQSRCKHPPLPLPSALLCPILTRPHLIILRT
eukprot:EG_transcript_35356